MSACKIIKRLQKSFYCISHEDDFYLVRALNYYREKWLNKSIVKNGYQVKNKLNKNTPKILIKTFAQFERKIIQKPLLKKKFKSDYFIGIKMIYDIHYELKSISNKQSKQDKRIEKLAKEYVENYLKTKKS